MKPTRGEREPCFSDVVEAADGVGTVWARLFCDLDRAGQQQADGRESACGVGIQFRHRETVNVNTDHLYRQML